MIRKPAGLQCLVPVLFTAGVGILPVAAAAAEVAHYTFDETSGSIAHDSVGSINGTLQGNAAFAPGAGILGGAISLDRATNDLVNMGNNFAMTEGVSFSIQSWVRLAAGDVVAEFPVAKHRSSFISGYFLHVSDSLDGCGVGAGKAGFYTAYPCVGGSSLSVNDGQWH